MKMLLTLGLQGFFCASLFAQHAPDSASEKPEKYNSVDQFFKGGMFQAHTRSNVMGTWNRGDLKDDHALASGAGIGYISPKFHGFGFGLNGFFVFGLAGSNLTEPDTFTKQMNRYELGLFDVEHPENRDDLDRLEESYIYYAHRGLNVELGRMNLNTPLINPQDGRMRPSLEEGIWASWKLHDNRIRFQGGWLWSMSPRSTVLWYRASESMGIYPSGVNTFGKVSAYKGNLHTDGIFAGSASYRSKSALDLQAWNYLVQNIFNVATVQAEQEFQLPGKRKLKLGLQGFAEQKVNHGGNEDPAKAYFDQQESYAFSGRAELRSNPWMINLNYTRITAHGRFLFPREWGRDGFYTFLPRERNEGFGDLHAATMNAQYKPGRWKGFSNTFSLGYYNLPGLDNVRMNKYNMTDYLQVNNSVKYAFQGALKGLDLQLLLAYKANLAGDIPLKAVYNKVDMLHLNFILNYYFSSGLSDRPPVEAVYER